VQNLLLKYVCTGFKPSLYTADVIGY
jgi:hypothetical protein